MLQLAHSTENTARWGCQGMSPHLRQQPGFSMRKNILIGSFIKTHCTSTFPSHQPVFPPHLHLGLSIPISGRAAFRAPATPFRRFFPHRLLLIRKSLPGTTTDLINKGKLLQEHTAHGPASRSWMGTGRNPAFLSIESFMLFSVLRHS